MQINKSITILLKRLWQHISPRRRRQFALLQMLMLITSFADMLSIGAVLPFLGVLTYPERVFENTLARPIIQELNLTEPSQLILPLTILFCTAAFVAGAMRVLLLWTSTRLTYAIGSDLSHSVYRRTLYQPYATHCARNSSELITGISIKSLLAISFISNILSIVTSVVMLVIVLITLLAIQPLIALAAFFGFGLIYMLITLLAQKQLLKDSHTAALESTHVIKILQEGLGGIRDVLIDGSQATYCQIYRNADKRLRRAQGNHTFISASPRHGTETLGMILIAGLAYSLAVGKDGLFNAIPILGALALGAQRLLPTLQNIYAAWSGIQGNKASLQDYLELLDQPLPEYANQPVAQQLLFRHSINFKQLSFSYSDQSTYVLEKLNLTILKGARVGFIGTTGSGKSTLLDIVMGLLQPTSGTMEIDGQAVTHNNNRAWQAHIAHVPQAIFLTDGTIEENIAFGVLKDQIDTRRVRLAAQQAQISGSIESWPNQYQTIVGERGIRLSGGQRQRIGIARALYKQADVIVFDEATSALDYETEQAVMQAVADLSKELTLLIIAHRIETLKNCTQIVELGAGGIKRIGSYQEIVSYAKAPEIMHIK
jgi:ABC-type bacteriocin/lantibiotic exporter with double-glycine peptidase domain